PPLRARLSAAARERVAQRFSFAAQAESYRELFAGLCNGKGDRHLLPERPEGCCAQKVPVPFSAPPERPVGCCAQMGTVPFSAANMSLRSKIAAVPFARMAYRGMVGATRRCGVPALWRTLSGRRHIILTFHRVRPSGAPADSFDTCPSTSADEFRRILQQLRERFAVVPLDELCARRAEKRPLAAVTFDDGWRDNYTLALPILRELDVPATIFITTGKIGCSAPFWQQELGRAFRIAGEQPAGEAAHRLRSLLGLPPGRPFTPELYRHTVLRWKRIGNGSGPFSAQCIPHTPCAESRHTACTESPHTACTESRHTACTESRHTACTESRHTACTESRHTPSAESRHTACAEYVIPSGPRLFLDADEIRAMAASGVEFGSHTVSHAILTRLPPAEIERELSESKAALESLLGKRIDALAYPDGRYSAEIMRLARSAGYRIACTTDSRWVAERDRSIGLPRIEPPYFSCNGVDSRLAAAACADVSDGKKARSPRSTSDKIKILFLIDDFEGPEGGTEQHLLFLQRELPRERFELHFGVLSRIRRMRAEDFPVRPIMLGEGTPPGPRGALQRLRILTRLIRECNADVVHAFCRRSELYACLAVRWAGRGKVLGVRRNIGYWHTRRSRWSARLVGLLGAHYAANCQAARQFAARVEWIPERRVTVIHNPLPAKRLAEGLANVASRQSLGIGDGEQVVGMVAVVKPIKDYATFLRSARLVLDKLPRTRFLAIGPEEPHYAGEMRQLARDLGIDGQVSWLGPMPNPMSVLPLLDAAVLSSRSEAMSNSIVEYMAAGRAIVATDVGGARELIDDGRTGFLVPPQSPESMARRISQLLADPKLQNIIGENARQKAENDFSKEIIFRKYTEFYSRMANGAD
ncbi:MAG: polysaccharide deacetylase family protein, partial [Pirellulaceae bacterium]|nr:polysaccharide deacetylase family protein [Pirellulaceae bacterium]